VELLAEDDVEKVEERYGPMAFRLVHAGESTDVAEAVPADAEVAHTIRSTAIAETSMAAQRARPNEAFICRNLRRRRELPGRSRP
jgi:hypothetical protein